MGPQSQPAAEAVRHQRTNGWTERSASPRRGRERNEVEIDVTTGLGPGSLLPKSRRDAVRVLAGSDK